jgi:threonine dehydratase
VIGVEPEGADAVRRSREAGRPVVLDHPHSIADKLVAKSTDQLNVDLIRKYVDDMVTVTDAAIETATYDYLERLSLRVEPSGAATLAAVRSGAVRPRGRTVLVVSGGNASPAVLARILAEHAPKATLA